MRLLEASLEHATPPCLLEAPIVILDKKLSSSSYSMFSMELSLFLFLSLSKKLVCSVDYENQCKHNDVPYYYIVDIYLWHDFSHPIFPVNFDADFSRFLLKLRNYFIVDWAPLLITENPTLKCVEQIRLCCDFH